MYYFAYGSNMNWEQMQRRCPSARFVCVASLADYSFAIARHSRLRNCGTANIFPDPGSTVWGILYHVSEADLEILDGFEDGYVRENVSVVQNKAGEPAIETLVYIAQREDNAPLPNPEYKRLMVQGARYWKLPLSYVAMLERLEVARETDMNGSSSSVPDSR